MSTMRALRNAIGEFRKLNLKSPMEQAYIFFYLASLEKRDLEEMFISEIGEKVGINTATIHRLIMGMTDEAGGPGLLETRPYAPNQRRRVVSFTPKGQALARRFDEIVKREVNR